MKAVVSFAIGVLLISVPSASAQDQDPPPLDQVIECLLQDDAARGQIPFLSFRFVPGLWNPMDAVSLDYERQQLTLRLPGAIDITNLQSLHEIDLVELSLRGVDLEPSFIEFGISMQRISACLSES